MTAGGDALALLIETPGNQAEVLIDGKVIASFGKLGDSRHDAGKASYLVPLRWRTIDHDHELEIITTVQRQRAGGLGVVRIGAEAELNRLQGTRQWIVTASIIYAVGFFLMGALSAGLWLRQRDPLYGCFSLAAFSGVCRNLDRGWLDIPVPWPLWGAVVAVTYALHIALISRFVLLAVDKRPVLLLRSIYLGLGASIVLACASFMFSMPMLWTIGQFILIIGAAACVPYVVQKAIVSKSLFAWGLLIVGSVTILSGIRGVLMVRLNLFGGSWVTITPHAMFVFVAIMGAMVVDRYGQLVKDFEGLSRTLQDKVKQREEELRKAFEFVKAQQEEQAVLLERQRMMREIHDGVGSHLVGLLNVVTQAAPDRSSMEAHVKLALDEMRMAVDSLQDGHSDLGTVLATLRYRVQARLDAAGLRMLWQVESLPGVSVTAQESLQIQRILLEAFTNVMKHAQARTISVVARADDRGANIRIEITDDGRGIRINEGVGPKGRGLGNMEWRARSIGAVLTVGPHSPCGTIVAVDLPRKPGVLRTDASATI
ncbi:ATP-binding protein [Variovorax guangxiensis]|uniref:sensor histidine kinase n=1 Tax=Variovorax guangxiensis TaxID=1775474 RepID=UPI002860A6D6|nr:ATP-binding protein [Variovorax guangxiensis]MDR6859820.1 signal transduction histidine kinase [Variovorax guangxiensis]